MHVSPAKHSSGSVTDGLTDRRWTKWSLCVAMLPRRHKNVKSQWQTSKKKVWQMPEVKIYLSPSFWSPPQGHAMSVRCEQCFDELRVQVWLLYYYPKFRNMYYTLYVKTQSDIHCNSSATSPRPKFITIAEESQLGFAGGRRLIGDWLPTRRLGGGGGGGGLLRRKTLILSFKTDELNMVHFLSFIYYMYWKINGCKDYTMRSMEIGRSLQPWCMK